MSQGRRTQPLPRGWERLRRYVLVRDDYVCYVCGGPGADAVDHVVPASRGGMDDLSNLRAIHEIPCHQRKTALEANDAQPRRKRPPEPHPGLIGGGG